MAQIESVVGPSMGGQLGVHLRPAPGTSPDLARHLAESVHRRIGSWADRLTRFSDDSDLARLNADPAEHVAVRPTLAAVLGWGRRAATMSDGVVDITLLGARLEAEFGPSVRTSDRANHDGSWTIEPSRRGAVVSRPGGLRFDLDGVAKGWLADRALQLLERHPAAVIDADGDVAVSLHCEETWQIGVSNPHDPAGSMLSLEVRGLDPAGAQRFGLATSGTSVHRWPGPDAVRHHLIDPRTRRPALTDVVQATVLARSAAEAEAYAKAVVILGSQEALRLLDRPGQSGAIVFTERGEVLATPAIVRWLA
jgi:FAD:protein FMN transferase